jgi:hypothetical protein
MEYSNDGMKEYLQITPLLILGGVGVVKITNYKLNE